MCTPVLFHHRLMAAIAFAATILCCALRSEAQDARFQPVNQGLEDLETGLIWGNHFAFVNAEMSGSTTLYTWDYAMGTWVIVWGDPDGDGVLEWVEVTYQEFNDSYYGPPEIAGGVWRLPTLEELQDAIAAGLVDQLDLSPADGLQLFEDYIPGVNEMVWSSTEGGKKRGGFDSAYRVSLLDGHANNITVGSWLAGAIPVYDPTGGGGSDGGGSKGGGKGKNK